MSYFLWQFFCLTCHQNFNCSQNLEDLSKVVLTSRLPFLISLDTVLYLITN